MIVIWISNISPLPVLKNNQFTGYGGGWLKEQYMFLKNNNIKVVPFFPGNENKKILEDNFEFVTFKPVNFNIFKQRKIELFFNTIIKELNPDLIHIHGTELPHCFIMSKVALNLKIPYIVSLQGIVSEIYKHILTGIDPHLIFKKSIRDYFLPSSLIGQRNLYIRLSRLEKKVVANARYILGRTEWDKSWIELNFDISKYVKCNEPLRKSFYSANKWEQDKCELHTIFLSQSNTSIKGLHILLEAILLIKFRYPNIKLYVAGKNYASNTLRNILLRTSYENFIINYIKSHGLTENIIFIGPQDEEGMIKYLLSTNIYIQSSVIENSPNSLMEAIYLGVPCITSYVGGIPSLYNNVIYYQSDSSLMLAASINKVFNNQFPKPDTSQQGVRYTSQEIGVSLLNIYNNSIK